MVKPISFCGQKTREVQINKNNFGETALSTDVKRLRAIRRIKPEEVGSVIETADAFFKQAISLKDGRQVSWANGGVEIDKTEYRKYGATEIHENWSIINYGESEILKKQITKTVEFLKELAEKVKIKK